MEFILAKHCLVLHIIFCPLPQVALKDHTVYCASKAALDSLTRTMALELGPHNIRVNSVNPTVVMTEMGKMAWSDPGKSGPVLNKIPLNRFSSELKSMLLI